MAAELEAARDAASLPDLFARLEAARLLQRIDPSTQPTMYRCAVVSDAELAQLRRITNVVRLGHVRAVETGRIVLDHGEIATSTRHVRVHCSAASLPRGPAQAEFQGHRILPQYVRRCSPTFSAAFNAYLEATIEDEHERNALCEPVTVPEVPIDWLRMHLQTARNQLRWSQRPDLQDWLRRSRLEAHSGLFDRVQNQADPAWAALPSRLRRTRVPGLERMAALLHAAERVRSNAASRQSHRPAGFRERTARAAHGG